MTYSWYIRSDYGNKTVKYTHDDSTWQTTTFKDRMYSSSDINDYVHLYMDQKGDKTDDKYHTNITFILSTYFFSFHDNNYQLDLRNTQFGELIGFEEKSVTKTEYGTKLPNITNLINVLNINTSVITDITVNGENTNII